MKLGCVSDCAFCIVSLPVFKDARRYVHRVSCNEFVVRSIVPLILRIECLLSSRRPNGWLYFIVNQDQGWYAHHAREIPQEPWFHIDPRAMHYDSRYALRTHWTRIYACKQGKPTVHVLALRLCVARMVPHAHELSSSLTSRGKRAKTISAPWPRYLLLYSSQRCFHTSGLSRIAPLVCDKWCSWWRSTVHSNVVLHARVAMIEAPILNTLVGLGWNLDDTQWHSHTKFASIC